MSQIAVFGDGSAKAIMLRRRTACPAETPFESSGGLRTFAGSRRATGAASAPVAGRRDRGSGRHLLEGGVVRRPRPALNRFLWRRYGDWMPSDVGNEVRPKRDVIAHQSHGCRAGALKDLHLAVFRIEARKSSEVGERWLGRPGQRGRAAAGGGGPGSVTGFSPSSRHTLSFMPASPSSSIAARYRPFGVTSMLDGKPAGSAIW